MNMHFSKGPVDWEPEILSGRKTVSLRSAASRWRPGAVIHFVADRFKPTRRVFATHLCTHVEPVKFTGTRIQVSGQTLSREIAGRLALADGFRTVEEMVMYHGNFFEGVIVNWGTEKYGYK